MKHLTLMGSILITFLIVGCGGGSIDDSISGGGGENYYVKINSFTVSPTNITNGTTLTVSWNIDYNSPAGFWVEFHMNSNNTTSEAFTRHFYFNGGIPYGVNKTDSATCSIIQSTTSNKLTAICKHGNENPQSKDILFTGSGYAIFKACIYDASMNKICDTESKQVTVY